MTKKDLPEIAERIKEIDLAMLSTHAPGGAIAARPMSNNQDVEYDGDSYYFSYEDADLVGEIEKNPHVGLTFHGGDKFFVAVAGKAELIRDRAAFEKHWKPGLDKWFENGIETDGIVLVKVSANHVHYWDGEEDGEVAL